MGPSDHQAGSFSPSGAPSKRISSPAQQRASQLAGITTGKHVKTEAGRRRQDALVNSQMRTLRKRMPWLNEIDLPTVRAWAELEVLSQAMFDRARERGIFGDDGAVREIVNEIRNTRRVQLALARELGLTPLARKQAALDDEFDGSLAASAAKYRKEENREMIRLMRRNGSVPTSSVTAQRLESR